MNKELRLGTGTKIPLNGGLCLYEESSIELNQSPYDGLLNICLDNGGQLTKRKGQMYSFKTELGQGGFDGVYSEYKEHIIFAHKGKIYKFAEALEPVEIYSGINIAKTFMFTYNGILYILTGKEYLQYDGKEVKPVEPYKPRVALNKKPDGSKSDMDESWNMIGTGFRESFNGDGTSKDYHLSMQDLDDDTITCNLPGVTEGGGFTVNRAAGVVSFTVAPKEGTNNVEITAFKSFPDLPKNILNCKFGVEFSNRMFLSGNSEVPNFYFAGGLTDDVNAAYFPQKYQYAISGGDKAVTGFKVHHNRLVVFKENVTCTVESTLGPDGMASFPIQYLNTDIGCDMPNTIALVNNNIVFSNTYGGVHMIVSTQVPGEKSILPISQNINGDVSRPGLLLEPNVDLINAAAIDYQNKYYLCVGDNCYVLDYKDYLNVNKPNNLRWFYYDNIKAKEFVLKDNTLYYSHRERPMLVQFINAFNDFGQPINAIFTTKLIDFGFVDWLKNVNYIWFTCKANSSSSVDITFFNDVGSKIAAPLVPSSKNMSFSWKSFSWSSFCWNVQNFSPTFKIKAKVKKIRYFKVQFQNNKFNENLTLLNLVIDYMLIRRVK